MQSEPDMYLSVGGMSGRRRRLSSDNKIELIQKALTRLRPLLVLMRLVDSLKQKWDIKRLGITSLQKHDVYLQRLTNEILSKGNL